MVKIKSVGGGGGGGGNKKNITKRTITMKKKNKMMKPMKPMKKMMKQKKLLNTNKQLANSKFHQSPPSSKQSPTLTTMIEKASSSSDDDDEDEDSDLDDIMAEDEEKKQELPKDKSKAAKKQNSVSVDNKVNNNIQTVDNDDDDDDDDSDQDDGEMTGLTPETLERLKQKDPDFYNYLQENDKDLLELDDEDDEVLMSGDDEDDDSKKKNIEKLEEEMDEKITLKLVKQWRKVLQGSGSKEDGGGGEGTSKAADLSAIKSIIKAFRKTVNQTTDPSDTSVVSMTMLDPAVFNAIINTVLVDLLPAVLRFLRLDYVLKSQITKPTTNGDDGVETQESQKGEKQAEEEQGQERSIFYDPRRSRNWKRIQSSIKIYLTDVLKMMATLSADARASFQRHVLELTPLFNCFPHLIKRLVRRSIDEWCGSVGGGEDRNRVLAYLLLHRTVRAIQSNHHLLAKERQLMINQILRKLYLSYVTVARNTNEFTIASISFMKNSLCELYQLDEQLAYQHAFIFIRQLAINLRSSYTLKDKNALKTVYNWQFVHSILLWSQLIATAHRQTDVLDPLITPLVMVISGTMKLLPSIKFLPLRFHLIRALIKLSVDTGKYIPVLRYFIEIYTFFDPSSVKNAKKGAANNDSKKKQKKKQQQQEINSKKISAKVAKKKQINFEVSLKVTKEQTTELDFFQKAIQKYYTLCLQYLASQSASIAFPELCNIFLHQTRKFVQNIRFPAERLMMKQLVDKVAENAKFIEQKRKSLRCSVKDSGNITSWERALRRSESTPLAIFNKKYKTFKLAANATSTTSAATNSTTSTTTTTDLDQQTLLKAHELLANENAKRTFDVKSDIIEQKQQQQSNNKKSKKPSNSLEDDEDELDDDELAELEALDDDDDEIPFGDDDNVEILYDSDIEVNGKNLDNDDNDEEEEKLKKKRKKNKKKKDKSNKKPRKLNNNLQLEGAFELSSDDDDDNE